MNRHSHGAKDGAKLSPFVFLATLSPHGTRGSFFAVGQDVYKRVISDQAEQWFRLDVVCGPPVFGKQDLITGFQLLEPEYVGSHWIPATSDETAMVTKQIHAGEAATIDGFLGPESSYEWEWETIGKPSTAKNNVFIALTPDGQHVWLRKTKGYKGNKSQWFVSFLHDKESAPVEYGVSDWCGALPATTVKEIQRQVEDKFRWSVSDCQQKIQDADSGTFFGQDRSWETTSPDTLVKVLISLSKVSPPAPLSAIEMRRLLELNGQRNRTGRFAEDRRENLSLDHLYAELFVRYLAFDVAKEDKEVVESIKESGSNPVDMDFSGIRRQMLEAGRAMYAHRFKQDEKLAA